MSPGCTVLSSTFFLCNSDLMSCFKVLFGGWEFGVCVCGGGEFGEFGEVGEEGGGGGCTCAQCRSVQVVAAAISLKTTKIICGVYQLKMDIDYISNKCKVTRKILT